MKKENLLAIVAEMRDQVKCSVVSMQYCTRMEQFADRLEQEINRKEEGAL